MSVLTTSAESKDALALYQERETCYGHEASEAKQAMGRWSNWRLIIFLVVLGAIIWTVKNNQPVLVLLFLVGGLGSFVAAIIRHNHHTRKFERASRVQQINREGIQRCQGTWQQKTDLLGEEFINKAHPYASDLDLFGRDSLFQWFNTARTKAGQETLAGQLLKPQANEGLADLQQAIKELAGKLDWRQQIEAEGMAVQDKDLTPLFAWAESPPSSALLSRRMSWLRFAPLLTAAVWLVLWVTQVQGLAVVALSLLIIQTLVANGISRAHQKRLEQALKWENELAICKTLLELVEGESFAAAGLNQQVVSRLQAGSSNSSSKALASMETLLSWLSLRNNPIVHFVFNAVGLWDAQWLIAIERWRRDHGHQVRRWMDQFAQIEARCSLAVIPFENPQWVVPETSASVPLDAVQLGHPLLPDGRRVQNDFSIPAPGCVTIITGSNMSGKSTFLRTVGVNLVLANAGAPVCAKRFVFTPMALFTSMRIADDMSSGVSSFYAELLRIKMIVDAAKAGPMLYLVDEIFRGTNSGDRVAGAIEVLKSLSKTHAVGLVSTHDLELSRLEQYDAGKFANRHFTERFTDDGIEFDYTIQPGPATTTNARQLIRMVGIGE